MEEDSSEDTSGIESGESGVLRARQDQGEDNSSHESREETSATERDQLASSDPGQEGLQDKNQPEIKWRSTAGQYIWTEGEASEMHEKELLNELKRLSAQSMPSRDRLAIFSDVFDDVCNGSPVFGRILREIKGDYDFYIKHLTFFQLPNVSSKDIDKAKEMELIDAEEVICGLEEEVRKALEEKKQVQQELDSFSTTESSESDDTSNGSELSLLDGFAAISYTSGIQRKRLEVKKVCKAIQALEKDIEENMMPVAEMPLTEAHIKEIKTRVVKLVASNDCLRILIKNELDDIQKILNAEKATRVIRRIFWDEIYSEIELYDDFDS